MRWPPRQKPKRGAGDARLLSRRAPSAMVSPTIFSWRRRRGKFSSSLGRTPHCAGSLAGVSLGHDKKIFCLSIACRLRPRDGPAGAGFRMWCRGQPARRLRFRARVALGIRTASSPADPLGDNDHHHQHNSGRAGDSRSDWGKPRLCRRRAGHTRRQHRRGDRSSAGAPT